MNDIPKVNEKRNADKKFCRRNKKIAEQVSLLGYFYISQKFLSVDVWFGLCENSHNANGKKSKRNKKYCKKFQNCGPNGKKVSMLGVEAQEKLKKEAKLWKNHI